MIQAAVKETRPKTDRLSCRSNWLMRLVGLVGCLVSSAAWAHDPIFGIGPHVLFKGGVEIAPEMHIAEAGDKSATETGLNITYGLTGDWAAGVELPYLDIDDGSTSASGRGDINLFTKYRFWRNDTLGAQESAAVLLKVKLDTANGGASPALGTGTMDTILGLAYGYEGRKWYRWASIRYRLNGTNDAGLQRGQKILFDLVGGIRFKPTGYLEPDTVWLLELNGEYGDRADINGANVVNTGGTEWFVSPGIFWTRRNFAIKAGVQIPIVSNLNGAQNESDVRATLTLEWHL
jgi:Putative MetA-pathway of phenol degradation